MKNTLLLVGLILANLSLLAQEYAITSGTKDYITITFDTTIDVSKATIKIWSWQQGLKDYAVDQVGKEMTIHFDNPCIAGDELHITCFDIQNIYGDMYPKKSFKTFVPAYKETKGQFDIVDTGIVLPEEALEYHRHIRCADLNKDGLVDFIARYHEFYGADTKIITYIRNSDGTYEEQLYTHNESHSSSRSSVDVNNDGYPDLLISYNVPPKINVRLNLGDGTFGDPVSYRLSPYTSGARPADIDADGDLDLVCFTGISALDRNRICILENNGNGTFKDERTIHTDQSYNAGNALADLDGDGDLDIVKAGQDDFGAVPRLQIYDNDGNGNYTRISNQEHSKSVYLADVRDLNGDGYHDMLLAINSLSMILGNGDHNYNLADTISAFESGWGHTLLLDADADNDLDLFSSRNRMLLENKDGQLYPSDSLDIDPNFFGLNVTDFNSDGAIDYYYVDQNRRVMMLMNQDASSSADNKDSSFTHDFKLYPNPTHNRVNIYSETKLSIQVCDISGQVAISGELVVGTNQIDVSGLSEGIYIILDQKNRQVGKFVKSRD